MHYSPTKQKLATVKLPSSAINRGQLLEATTIIRKYPGLVYESKIGTLVTKLAKEAFFGDDVLIQCTVSDEWDYPGLLVEELMQPISMQSSCKPPNFGILHRNLSHCGRSARCLLDKRVSS